MGIDVYTYALQSTSNGDTLVGLGELTGIDWREVVGHPVNTGWSEDQFWAPGDKLEIWDIGYIRESYHGHVHPVNVLLPESFERDSYETFGKPNSDGDYEHYGIHISVPTLKERLPETLEVARTRFEQYGEDPTKAEEWWGYQQYIDFVKIHEYLARGDIKCYIYNSY